MSGSSSSLIRASDAARVDPLPWYGLDKNGDMALRNCLDDWITLWCTTDLDEGICPYTPPPLSTTDETLASSMKSLDVSVSEKVHVEEEEEEEEETLPEDGHINPNATNVLTMEIKFRALRALILKCVKTSEYAEDLIYMIMQYLNTQIALMYPEIELIPAIGSEETVVNRCCEFMVAYSQHLFDDLEKADCGNRYVNLHAFVYKYFQIPIFHQHLAFIVCHRLRTLGYVTHRSSFACSILGDLMHPHWRRHFKFRIPIKTQNDADSIQSTMQTQLMEYKNLTWKYNPKKWRCARTTITLTNRSKTQAISILRTNGTETRVWNTPATFTRTHAGLGDVLSGTCFTISSAPATLLVDMQLHCIEFPHLDEFRHAIESYEARTC